VAYAYPSVAEQESDPDSLLNYYKAALALRIRFPAISRGTTQILPAGSEAVCLALRTWGEESVLLAVNPSQGAVVCPLEGEAAGYAVLGGSLVTGEDQVTLDGTELTLPAYSIAVLTK
jgi:glycosidase